MEWQVIDSRLIARQLERAPLDIQGKYAVWRERVQHGGPNLRGGYRTHSLKGKRRGQKTAYLDRRWRVIFRSFQEQMTVEALELTPHRY